MSQYQVENMKCNGCVSAVKTALERLDGVESVEVSLEQKTADIVGQVEVAVVEKTLSDLGYPASLIK